MFIESDPSGVAYSFWLYLIIAIPHYAEVIRIYAAVWPRRICLWRCGCCESASLLNSFGMNILKTETPHKIFKPLLF